MGYPNQMFITQRWYEHAWWVGSDCSDQDMISVINNTLAVSVEPLDGEDALVISEVPI